MRIDGYEGLLVASYFDLPTVHYEEIKEMRSSDDETRSLQMPAVLEVLSRRKKKPARFFREEEEMKRWIRESSSTRERDDRIVIKEQPAPLGRLRVKIGLRYDTGKAYINLSPYPDCRQLLNQGVVPVTLEFNKHEECSQYKLYELIHASGIRGHILGQIGRILLRLMNMFYQGDFYRIFVTPLIISQEQEVLIGGIAMEMDDGALSRQEKILQLLHRMEPDSLVSDAEQAGLIYRSIDPEGTIGLMASGMGLALSSLDSVVKEGLSVFGCIVLGGGLSEERMASGVRIMTQIPKVRGVFINLYGGANSCEIMAKGIVDALEDEERDLNIVIKMGGHDQEEGWRILDEAGLVSVRNPSSAEAVRRLHQLISQKKET